MENSIIKLKNRQLKTINNYKMKIKLYLVFTFLAFFIINSYSQQITVGTRMPQFELMDQHGEYFNSLDYINKQPMVVFFYTEDASPICTKEVLTFNENLEEFEKLGAVVIGINPATIISHRKFVVKLQIKYPILFDRNNQIQKNFRIPNVKKTKLPQRFTFIMDKKGIIQKIVHRDDNAEVHIIEALKFLKDL